jgi:hypothetical protein
LDLDALTSGVVEWLGQLNGRPDLIGEAALVVAIGLCVPEIFSVEVERDFNSVETRPGDDQGSSKGYFNYDLLVSSEGKPFCLFEVKYLKSRPSGTATAEYARVADDLIKLAAPTSRDLRRFFVVGMPRDAILPHAVSNLLGSNKIRINRNSNSKVENADGSIIVSPSVRLENSIKNLGRYLEGLWGADFELRRLQSTYGSSPAPTSILIYEVILT